MSTLSALAGATAAQIATARETVVSYLETRYPTLSVRAGPLADLVLGPAADALAAVTVTSGEVTAALDPYTALANGGYDPATLATVLAGLGVTRGAAAAATGSLAVHISSYVGVTVPNGFQAYTAAGVYYATSTSARVLAPGATPTAATDVAAVPVPSGGYAVVVPAAATVAAAAGNVPAGTSLTAVSPLAVQTALYTATDFTGGADAETDAALLARLPAATAARTAASGAGALAVVEGAVPALVAGVALGFGNPGMLRGRSVLTGQTPGRMDLRVRTAAPAGRVRVPVTATLIGTVPFGTWQFELGATAAPGFFLVEQVLPQNANLTGSWYPPAAVVPGFDLTLDPVGVDVRTAADAAQSTYATALVTFVDPTTPTGGLTVNVSTMPYDASVRLVPGLDAAQAAIDAAAVRAAGGDCLVRSACPVLVTLTAQATVQANVVLAPGALAAAVAAAVNATGIAPTLAAATVAAGAAAALPAGTALQLSAFAGTVYPTGGAAYAVTGATGLSVATNWALGVGPGAVAFYCDPTGVTATVTPVGS